MRAQVQGLWGNSIQWDFYGDASVGTIGWAMCGSFGIWIGSVGVCCGSVGICGGSAGIWWKCTVLLHFISHIWHENQSILQHWARWKCTTVIPTTLTHHNHSLRLLWPSGNTDQDVQITPPQLPLYPNHTLWPKISVHLAALGQDGSVQMTPHNHSHSVPNHSHRSQQHKLF
jgi:hypothetical protein